MKQQELKIWLETNVYSNGKATNRFTEKWFTKNGFETQWKYIQDIMKQYSFVSKEFLYRLRNDIPFERVILCTECNTPVRWLNTGYGLRCSYTCSALSKEKQEKSKLTLLQKTGYTHQSKNPDIKKQKEETCLKNWGTNNPAKTENFRIKFKKGLKTKLKKEYETRRKNKTMKSSKVEIKLFELLKAKFPDVKGGKSKKHRDIRYNNHLVDFYIPSLDLFIEYQGTWTHGGKPYNTLNEECNTQFEIWKEKALTSNYYKNAIYTWTLLDVEKRQLGQNLHWLEFWNEKEFINWLSSF